MSGAANASAYHPTLSYRADIDGLRGIAVALVVAFHASPALLSGGFIGVDVFFVISGFLISKIIYTERLRGTFSYANFYRRRIRRLLPAFSVVVLAVLTLGIALSLPDHLVDTGQSFAAAGVFSTNFLFWREAGYFAGPAELKPLLHTWSLAVEEQFYFVYPVLLLIGMTVWRRNGALAITLTIFVLSFAAAALLTPVYPEATFFLLPFRAWELMLGSLLAIAAVECPPAHLLRNLLVLAGLAMIVVAAVTFSSATAFPGYAAMLPVAGSALVIFAAGSHDSVSRLLLQTRPLVGLGKISYSLYLWHWPLFAYAHYRFVGEVPGPVIAGLVVLAVALSWASYAFVEQPFRKPGAMQGRKPFVFVAASSAAMLMAGVGLVYSDGLPQRFSAETRELIETRADRDRRRNCMATDAVWRDPAEACRYGSEAGPAHYALLGDSHAHALVESFGRVLGENGEAVRLYGYAGCAPIAGVEFPVQPNCERFGREALALLASDADVTTVVVMVRHAIHLHGDTADWGPAENGQGPAAFPSESRKRREARYFAALSNTVTRLRAAGKRVVLVQPVPETAYDIPRVAALLQMRGGSIDDFTRPRAMYDQRQGKTRSAIEDIARRTGATIADPASRICSAQSCAVSENGTLLYYDDDHLTSFAATRLARDIVAAASSN